MHKDEWEMVINAPHAPDQHSPAPASPPNQNSDAVDRHLPPSEGVLLPGEKILWRGAPRAGAGWRCLLRDRDSYPTLRNLVIPVLAISFFYLNGDWGPSELHSIAMFVPLVLATAAVGIALDGRRLRRARYIVTDRRAIELTGRDGWRGILSVPHSRSNPRRRETLCGTTIIMGRGVSGNDAAARWERAKGVVGRFFSGPSDDDPHLAFRALEPADAPFDLLMRLAQTTPDTPRPGMAPIPPVFPQ